MFNIMNPKLGIRKVRFRPCHGYALSRPIGSIDPTGWSTVLSTELPSCPLIGMVQIRYNWYELETSYGVYNFSSIQKHLDDLKLTQANGGTRRLAILLETKTFNASQNVTPAYTWDNEDTGFYGGGQYAFVGTSSGYIVRFDNVNVQARFAALAKALGDRFRNEVQIEMISMPETASGTPTGISAIRVNGSVDSALFQTFTENNLKGLLTGLKALRKYMPYTIIRQMINFPRKELTTSGFVVDAVAAGIALGSPDTYNDETGFEINNPYNGNYWWLRIYKGVVPIAMEVQNVNFRFSNLSSVVSPAKSWGSVASDITLVDNGGRIQLHSTAGPHGFSTTDFTNTLNAYTPAAIEITTTGANGNFPTGYYKLYSIDNANDFTIVNRSDIQSASWAVGSGTVLAGALAWSDVAAHSLTSPFAAMSKTTNDLAYPYGGQTYIPNNNTYLGYSPTRQQQFDFLRNEFNLNYIIWTRNTDTNKMSGKKNYLEVLEFLNTFAYRSSLFGGLNTQVPTAIR